VSKAEPVAVFMQNCPQFVIAYYAIQRIGAIVTPCSPMFREWELEYELNAVDARVVIANSYLYPIIRNVRANTKLEHVIISSFNEFLPEEPSLPFTMEAPEPDNTDGATWMMEAIRKTDAAVPEVEIDMDNDISLLIFTSGSTGLPKGAMLTFFGDLYKGHTATQPMYLSEYNMLLCTQPCYHIAGMNVMNGAICIGATNVMLTRFDAEIIMKAIEKYKIERWYGSALMNDYIINHPDVGKYNLSSLRITYTTSFGIQLTKEMAESWEKITNGGLLMEMAYGLSESHTVDTLTTPEYPKYGTTGIMAYEEMKIRIVDEEGKDCPTNTIGEILVKNPGVFKGYWRNPEATAQTLKDGWLYTGDIGKLDEEGFLYFLGRQKEMIKTSGYSVFPEEIEMFICRHEAVSQAIVIGKEDPKKGEVIKIFCVLDKAYKGRITENELIEWTRDKMAPYKRPREIEFREELPKTGTGKLLRRFLRDEEKAKEEKAKKEV
jgi:long-chain acyl-CoA synthetase